VTHTAARLAQEVAAALVGPATLRTIVFLASLAALIRGARGGTPQTVLLLLLGSYVVVSTIWVRSQYAASLGGFRPGRLQPRSILTAALTVLGVVLGLTAWFAHIPGLLMTGAILTYLGGGTLIMIWRELQYRRDTRPTVACVLLALGIIVLCLGSAFLGHWNTRVCLALLGLSVLVLIPIGLQPVSEWAITRVTNRLGPATAPPSATAGPPGEGGPGPQTKPRSPVTLAIGLGGLLVFALATVFAALYASSTLLAAVFVVIGLLVVAVVSWTWADIAAVFVVIAVLGVTPYQPSLPDAFSPGGGHNVLVALGDSYMSGEGAAVYYKGTDEGGGDQCHRSPTAWAAIAGQQPPFDRMAFLACSGARSYNVYLSGSHSPEAQRGEKVTQLVAYQNLQDAQPFKPRLVVLSLGGNDAGFSAIGEMCIAPGDCSTQSHLWTDSLSEVRTAMEHTYDQVGALFPNVPVLVVGYPDPIADGDGPCGQMTLTPAERRSIKKFVGDLDTTIAQAAANRHFYYLSGARTALADAHLQLCDPRNDGQPGLNFIGFRSVRGDPEHRFNPQNWIHNSLHPNDRGHGAILQVFERWIADNPNPAARAGDSPVPGASPQDAAHSAIPSPPCDLSDTSPHTCALDAQTWALRQLGGALWPWGLLVTALAVAGAWTAGVTLFGWRRSKEALAHRQAEGDPAARRR
jgi:hypothetical protein